MYTYSIGYLYIYIVLYVLRFKVTITSIVKTVMEVLLSRSTSITVVIVLMAMRWPLADNTVMVRAVKI